jgi:hypothetical protein
MAAAPAGVKRRPAVTDVSEPVERRARIDGDSQDSRKRTMRHLFHRIRRNDGTRATRPVGRAIPPRLRDYPLGRPCR